MSYHRKKGSGSRDLGLSSNGKGSASRITDNKAFADNYDAIDWGVKKTTGASESLPKLCVTELPPPKPLVKPEILPPTKREGWRKLARTEILQAGDEFWGVDGSWNKTQFPGWKARSWNTYFRKLK
jgi:hypothetical protein